MKCFRCGRELEQVGVLTDNEIEELVLINKKIENSNQALNLNTIRGMNFTEGQVFEYFRAVYDGKAQAEFLHFMFFRNLMKRLDLKEGTQIQIGNGTPYDYCVYVHKE